MQTLTALRRGILVPYQQQKGEVSKTYDQLFVADRGGLVFEPLLGIYPNVAISGLRLHVSVHHGGIQHLAGNRCNGTG